MSQYEAFEAVVTAQIGITDVNVGPTIQGSKFHQIQLFISQILTIGKVGRIILNRW